ncbi:NUDIX domain-containing protein [Emticicia sp. SJ17W-69]|uniref:NUDIX domain-containing protein n=1 Tax=Emticicia sp. SJ17W-69 TaxID=3421657 RepID=UPI003EBF656A
MSGTNYQAIAQQLYGNRIRVRVCGVCVENGQILLVCHRPILGEKDYWCPPGGGVDRGETAEEALKREFLEETGFEVEVGKLLKTKEFIQPPLHAIELYFSVKILRGNLIKGHDPEMNLNEQLIKDVSWLPLQNNVFSMSAF